MKLCKKRSTVRGASFFILFIFYFLLNIKSEVCFPTYVWEVIGALEKGKPISVGKCEIFIYFQGLSQHFLTSSNQIVDLAEKLHHKEDEFSSLCSELQVIKDTTLGK